jgi:putative CocE/NonD family hydrolase
VSGEWRDLDAWPPPTTPLALFPDAGGGLAGEAPAAGSADFTFDPADPTPTVGGPLLDGGGYANDSALARRADVLAFTGEPLPADLEMHGAPVAELWHRSDNPHADLFVRISEVDTRGRSRNVTEGYRRLPVDRDPAEPVRLPLLSTAHRFRAGHRIRLIVAGGSHPHYARNLGTGGNPGTSSELAVARHTLETGGSRVLLPIHSATG